MDKPPAFTAGSESTAALAASIDATRRMKMPASARSVIVGSSRDDTERRNARGAALFHFHSVIGGGERRHRDIDHDPPERA